jgi:hypothetical protein
MANGAGGADATDGADARGSVLDSRAHILIVRVPARPSRLKDSIDIPKKSTDWPRHPGALAGRLRRVQTPLRVLGKWRRAEDLRPFPPNSTAALRFVIIGVRKGAGGPQFASRHPAEHSRTPIENS